MKVLVAEDDEVSRILLERLLQKLGHDVTATKDGQEALETFRSDGFEMLLTDWMMPRMDGIELCRAIRELERECGKPIYIIMVTAKAESESMTQALGAGVDDFLTKPVDRRLLQGRIRASERYLGEMESQPRAKYEPLRLLLDEHIVLRNSAEVLDLVHDRLGRGVPDEVLKWCTSTAVLLTLKLHVDKEKYLLEAFVNALTSEHVDWFSEMSQSSFLRVEEGHEDLERCLMDLQGELSRYLMDDVKEETLLKESIRNYTDLLRAHIDEEERTFFPFIRKYLREEDKLALAEKFEEIKRSVGEERVMDSIQRISKVLDVVRGGGGEKG